MKVVDERVKYSVSDFYLFYNGQRLAKSSATVFFFVVNYFTIQWSHKTARKKGSANLNGIK